MYVGLLCVLVVVEWFDEVEEWLVLLLFEVVKDVGIECVCVVLVLVRDKFEDGVLVVLCVVVDVDFVDMDVGFVYVIVVFVVGECDVVVDWLLVMIVVDCEWNGGVVWVKLL